MASFADEGSTVDIILMAGLWLDAGAWDEVVAELRDLGHEPRALRLPGVDDRSDSVTLEDQVQAALAAVDGANRPLLVGHSAACTLAWIVADRRPDDVAAVVMIGGFPMPDGQPYAPFFEIVDGVMPFPGWEAFEGPDSADLDEETKERIAAAAIPVPAGVANGIISLTNTRRYDVPVHVICPEFSPDDLKEWVETGELPEVAAMRNYAAIDIDSGHWPMFTKPKELAKLIADIADARG